MSLLRLLPLIRRASILQFFLLLVLVAAPSVKASDSIERMVTGKWRFTKPIDSADITSLDEREAAQLVGHIFTIRKDKSRSVTKIAEIRNLKRRKLSRPCICVKDGIRTSKDSSYPIRSRLLK